MADRPRPMAQKRLSLRTTTKLLNVETESHNTATVHENKEQKNLNDTITKKLSYINPQYGEKIVYFNYTSKEWQPIATDDLLIKVFSLNTSYNHKDDKACEYQADYHKTKQNLKVKAKEIGSKFKEKEADSIKSLRNLITYAERSSQTINPEIITREIETVKLERNNHSGILHKWDIFDKYVEKYVEEEEDRKRQEALLNFGKKVEKKKADPKNTESLTKPSLLKTLKLVERQILQTLNYQQYEFYREWNIKEEVIDENKQFILILPFPQKASIRNRSVTAIVWNHKYEDLFAVGYGSYKFPSKSNEREKAEDKGEERSDDTLEPGYIFVYSIKNNHYPETKYTTNSGVLSLDFHSKEYSYLVAGMYDGTVAVYDIKLKSKEPFIVCDIRYQKHMDPVWQVRWNIDDSIDEYIFFSISSDGKVNKWSFLKNKATFELEEIIILKYSDTQNELTSNTTSNELDSKEKSDESYVFGNAGGMCFDFNPHKKFTHLFILGTEEGHIHLCSIQHRGHYIQSYEGHTMGVYTVTWNPYHEKVFASCSADWTIKIWHYKVFSPLIIFDMQFPVGDVAWSPWCSTIFAAVTVQGDMKFFDLNRNRKSHISDKKYHETAINHIAFNKFEFVFLTGNDRGKVRMWRMAEYLRTTIDKKEEELKKEEEKKKNSNAKSKLPTTKIYVPKNLQVDNKKKKKNFEAKKDNKVSMVNSSHYRKEEKDRIIEFLRLLDIKDAE